MLSEWLLFHLQFLISQKIVPFDSGAEAKEIIACTESFLRSFGVKSALHREVIRKPHLFFYFYYVAFVPWALAKVQTPAVARAAQPAARARLCRNPVWEEGGNSRPVRAERFARGRISTAHTQRRIHGVWFITSHYRLDSSTRKSETAVIAG